MIVQLNQYGLAVWRHRYIKNLFAIREYNDKDSVLFLSEDMGRLVVGTAKLTEWAGKDIFEEWISLFPHEYDRVKTKYSDIYGQ